MTDCVRCKLPILETGTAGDTGPVHIAQRDAAQQSNFFLCNRCATKVTKAALRERR